MLSYSDDPMGEIVPKLDMYRRGCRVDNGTMPLNSIQVSLSSGSCSDDMMEWIKDLSARRLSGIQLGFALRAFEAGFSDSLRNVLGMSALLCLSGDFNGFDAMMKPIYTRILFLNVGSESTWFEQYVWRASAPGNRSLQLMDLDQCRLSQTLSTRP